MASTRITRSAKEQRKDKITAAKLKKVAQKQKAKKIVRKSTKKLTKKKRQMLLEKAMDRMRKLRARTLDDPQKCEEYREKERERYHRRVAAGKIKKIAELTAREARYKRSIDRERKAKLRSEKFQENCPSSEEIPSEPEPSTSKQALVGKKRAKRRKRKCYNDLKKCQEKNKKLETALNTLKKKMNRLKIKENGQMPEFEKEIDDLLEKPNRNKLVLRKRLIQAHVLSAQLTVSYQKSRDHASKHTPGRMLAGKIVKKYKMMNQARAIAPILQEKIYSSHKIEKNRKRKHNTRSLQIKDLVQKFFRANSNTDPSKKGCKSIDGKMTTRMFMNASVTDLYAEFSSDPVNPTICAATFAKYRPRECVAPKVGARNTCACPTHENIGLLVKALKTAQVIAENSSHQIVRHVTCNNIKKECYERLCKDCSEKKIEFCFDGKNLKERISYQEWVTVLEERTNFKTGKDIKVSITKKQTKIAALEDVINIFTEKFAPFLLHEMRIFHQYHQIDDLKKNLSISEALIMMDFSENYLCKYSTEVQSIHFGASRQQVTLHTGYLYTPGLNQGFYTLSESLQHSPPAILAHLKEALMFYLPSLHNVTTLHFLSDGPTTQYRNKTFFWLMTQLLPIWLPNIQYITHNYSEAGHSKGPCDAIGGLIKRTADSEIAHGTDVNDFETFYTIMKQKEKNVHISAVTVTQIKEVEAMMKNIEPKRFTGTMKVHQFTWAKSTPFEINFNSLSCFDCLPGSKCDHFSLGDMSYSPNLAFTLVEPELMKNPPVEAVIRSKDVSKVQKKKEKPEGKGEISSKNLRLQEHSTQNHENPVRRSSRAPKAIKDTDFMYN